MQKIDTLLEELCEKEEEARNKPSEKKKNLEQEKSVAQDMRLKAVETMRQTLKRLQKSSGEAPVKKRRKSTAEAIGYLEKKSEQEMALRREEIEMRKRKRPEVLR